jgi:penicillin-binding protein 1B
VTVRRPVLRALRRGAPVWAALLVVLFFCAPAARAALTDEMGRAETRVWSAPYRPAVGRTVAQMGLAERLDRLGYERVHARPDAPGEYFWGHEVFWVYGRAHRVNGRDWPAERWGLEIDPADQTVTGYLRADGTPWRGRRRSFQRTPWVEPEILAESLSEVRAPRRPVAFGDLPERVWRPLLAAEDSRFFDHVGLDARGIARALLKNVLAGGVEQGGSTITQQLVKMRDLSPKRSLGRKASEAVRALALEAEVDKEEILEAYLDHVYLGHQDGVAVYGYGAAARTWFGKDTEDLTLAEAAALAAMVQGPNRLNPVRNRERLAARQKWVLERMEELGWATSAELSAARRQGLSTVTARPPQPPPVRHLGSWVKEIVEREAEDLREAGRGVWVETPVDAQLQDWAETAVAEGLAAVERRVAASARSRLQAALVALDADTGEVLAYVGGDPRAADAFDRVRKAKRQPGSTVKPLVVLEAVQDCGRREAVEPSRRILDAPLTLDLPSGAWRPENFDDTFRGPVTVRRALAESLNVPLVRLGRYCGFDAVARCFEDAGLDLPADPPPAFVLGAVETTPLELAEAYTLFGEAGRRLDALPVTRLERPSGAKVEGWSTDRERVVDAPSAYIVRDLMADALERIGDEGLTGFAAYGKTGTSSAERDAWMAGGAGSIVAVVWVGLDDGAPLGLTGAAAAAPIWRSFLSRAAAAYPARPVPEPRGIEEAWVEEDTGLRVRDERPGTYRELFRKGELPPRRKLLKRDEPVPVIE